ncbi:hypothetical protein HPGCJGGD_3643 [Methylobacterium haplocladii]|nr:hypothetical protein HPGCJGGD_3643 [Methylobacterium haplocladii]
MPMEFATSFAQLSTATGYSRSTLHERHRRGQIPQRGPQGWHVPDVLAAIRRNVDPARRKPVLSAPRSAERSEPNAEHPNAVPATGSFPVPEAYRDCDDLGDAFTRGALYGAHVVAFSVPTAVGCSLIEAGVASETAVRFYAEARDDVAFIVGDVAEALGLVPDGVDDAGQHRPTAFQAFDPQMAKLAITPVAP